MNFHTSTFVFHGTVTDYANFNAVVFDSLFLNHSDAKTATDEFVRQWIERDPEYAPERHLFTIEANIVKREVFSVSA